jgi:predicted esterase
MLDFRREDEIIQPRVHERTLVFLPGWSKSARSNLKIFKKFPILENTKIRIVQAPHRKSKSGIFQSSWFLIDPKNFNSLVPTLNEISKLINEILEEEYEICPNLFLGGFSQGGATALYTGLVTSTLPLLGIICLSCFIPPVSFKSARRNIPIFIYHGEKDEVLSENITQNSINSKLNPVFNFVYITEPYLKHNYSLKEFLLLKNWMHKCTKTEKL